MQCNCRVAATHLALISVAISFNANNLSCAFKAVDNIVVVYILYFHYFLFSNISNALLTEAHHHIEEHFYMDRY